jgi:hypothetical protein
MELTHKERVTLQNLDPKCEDCDYYREYNGRLMCHAMAPFYAAKETARRRPRGKTKNCGKEGYYFKPKESNSIKKERNRNNGKKFLRRCVLLLRSHEFRQALSSAHSIQDTAKSLNRKD